LINPGHTNRRPVSIGSYVEGIQQGNRRILAQAITLVESQHPDDTERAQEILRRLLPLTGGAHRIGISGIPGVGKSTLIDTLGTLLIEDDHRVAVLAVDPSSSVSGGSILGDKSRMPRLAVNPGAFIRPSPNALNLGGVTLRTRESMLLCEAAGYDVVLVETVGVGQSETMVANLVDTFLLLMLPGAGDELQGMKKGIVELADVIAVNKADGDNLERARQAQKEYLAALQYLPPREAVWSPTVLTVSAATGVGLRELWESLHRHRSVLEASGALQAKRRLQLRTWIESVIEERLLTSFRSHPGVQERILALERAVAEGQATATQAADELVLEFRQSGDH
jgi:LAO/AO transport system kinase